MPEKDDRAPELEKSEIACGVVFPSDKKASEVMQPSKEPFDAPALGITAKPAAITLRVSEG
jgi:hypothetical protein